MRHKRLKLSAVLFLVLGLKGLQAQESVNATGGNASGSGGSASYSVGQVTNIGTNNSMLQGVQQPYEILVVIGLEEVKGINLSVLAYPNPSTDYLTLEVKDFELSKLSFKLYNMQGKLLQNEKITSSRTRIIMNNLVPANYFVTVTQNNREVKTFKIIKN